MKVYVSADIEGIAGICHWDEASPERHGYEEFRDRMTSHVAAACEGAVAAGASEILVKDAHANARNVFADRLPECARVVRGWSGHPLMMVQELDATFDALAMVGYHARAGSGGNPLAHTMSSSRIALMSINGEPVSELHLHAWAGAYLDVPTVFVSGDEAICEHARTLVPEITAVPVMRGVGDSTVALHPDVAARRIRDGMEEALAEDPDRCRLELPPELVLEIRYHQATRAYDRSFYPGARLVDDTTVRFETDDYLEILRAVKFLI